MGKMLLLNSAHIINYINNKFAAKNCFI
jgi:hypothetical protein